MMSFNLTFIDSYVPHLTQVYAFQCSSLVIVFHILSPSLALNYLSLLLSCLLSNEVIIKVMFKFSPQERQENNL